MTTIAITNKTKDRLNQYGDKNDSYDDVVNKILDQKEQKKQFMKIVYVAGAYSNNPEANMQKAEKASIQLIKNGFAVITPHKNFYDYQKYKDIHYETYLRMDFEIIRRCDAVYVLDNWEESPGTKREIDICNEWNVPVFWQHQITECDFMPEMIKR